MNGHPAHDDAPQGAPPAQGRRRTLAGRSARSVLWSAVSQASQMVVGFVGVWLLAHFLGPTEYGIVGMAGTVIGVLGVVGDAGVTQALVRIPDVGPREQASGFWLAVIGSTLICVVGVAAAPLLGLYFGVSGVAPIAALLAAQFLFAAPARVSTALLSREMRFRSLAITSFVATIGAVGLALVTAALGAGPWALAFQTIGAFGIQSVILVGIRRYSIATRHLSRDSMRTLGAVSSQIGGANMIYVLARSSDMAIGGRWLGPNAPGLLAMALRFGLTPVQRLAWAVAAVFLPAAARLEPGEQGRAFARVVRLVLLVSGPVCGFIVAAADEITALLPIRWSGLAPVLRCVAIGSLLEPAASLAWASLVAQAPPSALSRASALLVPFAWIATIVGCVVGSPTALAAAWATTNIVWGVGLTLLAMRFSGAGYRHLVIVLGPLAASVALAVLAHGAMATLVTDAGIARLAIAFGTTLFFSVILAVSVFRKDVELAKSLLTSEK